MLYHKNISIEIDKIVLPDLKLRLDKAEIAEQREMLLQQEVIISLLNAIDSAVLVLSKTRQIIHLNDQALKVMGLQNVEQILGMRPGELVGCEHANDSEHGCGTGSQCAMCGALLTVLQAMKTGQKVTQEASLQTRNQDHFAALNLEVTAQPQAVVNGQFVIVSLRDISSQRRMEMLERVFLHDIRNTVSALSGLNRGIYDYLLQEIKVLNEDKKEDIDVLNLLHEKLQDQIDAHRNLKLAEEGTLELDKGYADINDQLSRLLKLYTVTNPGQIEVEYLDQENYVYNNETLFSQVMINLIKNALESGSSQEKVNIKIYHEDEDVVVSVQNNAYIPDDVQPHIFDRFYSTKGSGRGVGTYSIKLLTENYLDGKVSFRSSQKEGTTFYLRFPRIIVD